MQTRLVRAKPSKKTKLRPKKKNTERCKAYWSKKKKKKEKYKLNDALRKMIVRQKIKQYPTEKRLRLKKEAAAKREWRL